MTATAKNATSSRRIKQPCNQSSAENIIAPVCPACNEPPGNGKIERFCKYELFECVKCALQFWEPREMPGPQWYEQMYGGRDEKLLPLEPGHRYFLADPLAPRRGALLDIGCGTGNFLAAARDAGYEVTGTELDRNAARFAKERLGLPRVFPLTVSEFVETNGESKFHVVTFFEVLEHQAEPRAFLESVKRCLEPGGFIALSVPNRGRWMTGPDVLDYPPNHFLRWDAVALKNFLTLQGFAVLSIREQRATIGYTVQSINMALRTGMTVSLAGEAPAAFRELIQLTPEQAAAKSKVSLTPRQRAVQILGRIKLAASFPLALAAFPYVRLRGYKGTYLYCLARLHD